MDWLHPSLDDFYEEYPETIAVIARKKIESKVNLIIPDGRNRKKNKLYYKLKTISRKHKFNKSEKDASTLFNLKANDQIHYNIVPPVFNKDQFLSYFNLLDNRLDHVINQGAKPKPRNTFESLFKRITLPHQEWDFNKWAMAMLVVFVFVFILWVQNMAPNSYGPVTDPGPQNVTQVVPVKPQTTPKPSEPTAKPYSDPPTTVIVDPAPIDQPTADDFHLSAARNGDPEAIKWVQIRADFLYAQARHYKNVDVFKEIDFIKQSAKFGNEECLNWCRENHVDYNDEQMILDFNKINTFSEFAREDRPVVSSPAESRYGTAVMGSTTPPSTIIKDGISNSNQPITQTPAKNAAGYKPKGYASAPVNNQGINGEAKGQSGSIFKGNGWKTAPKSIKPPNLNNWHQSKK